MLEKRATADKYYEVILDWFKQQIVSGELPEGAVIPSERELAMQFGVSRVPVREALRILEYIGIIANSPDGMTVQKVNMQFLNPQVNFATEITMETMLNLFEVRMFLESSAAYYAALRRTDEDIERLRSSVRQMSKVLDDPNVDNEVLIRASHDFHVCIIAAAKNPVLDNIYRSLRDLLEVSKQHTIHSESVSESTLMEHEAILYKIEIGDAEGAEKYMKSHLTRAMKRLSQES